MDWLHGVAPAPVPTLAGEPRSPPPLAPRLTLCAELKRASPSAGVIAGLSHAQALLQAGAYMAAGAGVLSVLCEPRWFRGGVGDLRRIAMLRLLLSWQIRINSTAAEPVHPSTIVADAWHHLATSPLGALAAHYSDGAGDSPGFQGLPLATAATPTWTSVATSTYPELLPHVRAELAIVVSAYLALHDAYAMHGDMSTAFPTPLPALLLKDFVVHPYQLVEARACHADTALLIVALFLDSDRYAVAAQRLAREHDTLGPFSRTIDIFLTCACAPALRDSVAAAWTLAQEHPDMTHLSEAQLSALALALAFDLHPLTPPSQGDDDVPQHVCNSLCEFPCSSALAAATSLHSSQLPLLAHRVRLIAALRPCWVGVSKLCLLLVWARVLGLEPLVEAANARETILAVLLGARALGINNRDLHTFTVDVNAAVNLGRVAWRTRLALPGVSIPEDAAGERTALPSMCVFALSGVRGRAEVLPMEQPLSSLWEVTPPPDAPPSLAELLSDAAAVPDLPLALLRQLPTYAFPPLAVGDVAAIVLAAGSPGRLATAVRAARPAAALYFHADLLSGVSLPRLLVPPVPYVHGHQPHTGVPLIASVLVGEALMRAADPSLVTAPDSNAVAVAVRRVVADMLGIGTTLLAPAPAWPMPVRTVALPLHMHLPLPWRVLCKVCGIMDAAAACAASGAEAGSLSPSAGVSDLLGMICVPGKRFVPASLRTLITASMVRTFNSAPRRCDELYVAPSSRFAWAMRLHEFMADSTAAPKPHTKLEQWRANFPPLAALLCARLPLRAPGALPRIVAVCVTPTPRAPNQRPCVVPAFMTMQSAPLRLPCDAWLAPTHPLFPFCLLYIGAAPDRFVKCPMTQTYTYVASPDVRARALSLLHEYFSTNATTCVTPPTTPKVFLQLHGGEDVPIIVDVAVLTFISCIASQTPSDLRTHTRAFFAALPAVVPVVGVCPGDSASMVADRFFARISVPLDTIVLQLSGPCPRPEDSNPPVWSKYGNGWPCIPLECDNNASTQANAAIFSSTVSLATAVCSWWNHFHDLCEAEVGPGATVAPPLFSLRIPSIFEPAPLELRLLCPNVSAVLLDAQLPHAVGGTGAHFDWAVLEPLRYAVWGHVAPPCLCPPLPVIVAGGLTPEGVRDCCAQTGCVGVDVSSGVDSQSVCYDEHVKHEYYIDHGYLVDDTSTEFSVQMENSFNKDLSRVKAFVSNTQDN